MIVLHVRGLAGFDRGGQRRIDAARIIGLRGGYFDFAFSVERLRRGIDVILAHTLRSVATGFVLGGAIASSSVSKTCSTRTRPVMSSIR